MKEEKKNEHESVSKGKDGSDEKPTLSRGAIAGIAGGLAVVIVMLVLIAPYATRLSDNAEAPSVEASVKASERASETERAKPTASSAHAADAKSAESPDADAAADPAQDWINVEFSHSVVIGSSTTEALYIHDLLQGATFLYGTGLTVETVMTETMPGSDIPIIEELAGKDYNQVFLSFGLNELGWPDDNVFLQMYANIIARVREYLPTAAIYIESILPVTIEASERARFGVTQDRINQLNALLSEFATQQGVHFIDVSTEMKGPDGYLPLDASNDGIHPNLESCEKWAALIAARVEDVLNAGRDVVPETQEAAPDQSETAAQQTPDAILIPDDAVIPEQPAADAAAQDQTAAS